MTSETENITILRLTDEGQSTIDDVVVREFPLTIIFNNQELVTLLCSPKDLNYLAVGFLYSEGLLTSKDEIKKVTVDEKRGVVRVETADGDTEASELIFKRLITSGCGRGAAFYSAADAQDQIKVESGIQISAPTLSRWSKSFNSAPRFSGRPAVSTVRRCVIPAAS